jgi:microcystin-dependent protein
MSEPFLSEIRLLSFAFPPKGWALCDAQLMPINQNQPLFALLGTTYGGDGRVNFALPDLRGRIAIHGGNGHTLGERGGTDSVTLNIQQLPTHLHQLNASNVNSDSPVPTSDLLGQFNNGYRQPSNLIALDPSTVSNTGGSQAHENRQPFLALNYSIALQGIFPSPN